MSKFLYLSKNIYLFIFCIQDRNSLYMVIIMFGMNLRMKIYNFFFIVFANKNFIRSLMLDLSKTHIQFCTIYFSKSLKKSLVQILMLKKH